MLVRIRDTSFALTMSYQYPYLFCRVLSVPQPHFRSVHMDPFAYHSIFHCERDECSDSLPFFSSFPFQRFKRLESGDAKQILDAREIWLRIAVISDNDR